MEIKVISSEDAFLDIKSNWGNIYQKMEERTPFQTWEWNYFWFKAHPQGQLFLLEVFESKKVFAYLPLIIEDKAIKFIGDKHFDYGQIIVSEKKRACFETIMQFLIEKCKKEKLSLWLYNIPVTSGQYGLFKEYSEQNKKSLFREKVSTAYVDLLEYGSFDNYISCISSSLRKKAIKPCIKAGLEFKVSEFTEKLWQEIEEIYTKRQQERVGVSSLSWAKNVVKNLCEMGLLKISILRKNDKTIAFLIFFELEQGLYVWLTAFDRVEELRLGHYIRYCLIEKAYTEKKAIVDMMRGAYDYKKEWDCSVSFNYEFILFRNRIKKWAYCLKQKLRKRLRDFVYKHKKIKSFYKKLSKN